MNLFGENIEWTQPAGLAILALAAPVLVFSARSMVGFPAWFRVVSLAVRLGIFLLLAAALCGPREIGQSQRQFTIVAVDQSQSVGPTAQRRADAFLKELQEKRPPDDRLVFIPFAGQASLPTAKLPGNQVAAKRDATDLAAALAMARRTIPNSYVPQIVALVEGQAGSADAVKKVAAECGVPVSVVALPPPVAEVAVLGATGPKEGRVGEPLEIEVCVKSLSDNEGTVCVNDVRQAAKLTPGENKVQVPFTPGREGNQVLDVRLDGFRDEFPENNRGFTTVLVLPPRRALLVEGRTGLAERLAAVLREAKIEPTVVGPQKLPQDPEELARYDLMVVLNVPASALPGGWIAAARQCVEQRGTGLILVGGDQTFTPGGYSKTKLEELLPVAAYSRDDKDKPTLAMAIVIDRSASMLEEKRFELAKEATRRAVDRLGPRDQIGILAFDDISRWTSPIRPASEKKKILDAVAELKTEVRTNMAPALRRAHLALRESYADLKHIIVLTDGLSQAGDFTEIAREIAASGITITTLGLGRDVAGPLLADMARIGKGRYYPCENADKLPQIFTMETISAGKQGVTEKAFLPKRKADSPILAGLDAEHLPVLLGYVEAQPKPKSEVVLVSEAGDPILAWWQLGQGRTATFTSTVENRWAAAWLDWPDFNRFWLQLARHILRTDDPVWRRRQMETALAIPSLDQNPEFRLVPADLDLFRSIAKTTGGRFNPTPAELTAPTDRSVPQIRLLWTYFAAAAIAMFALDAILRRFALLALRKRSQE